MSRSLALSAVVALAFTFALPAAASSIGNYSGCKKLKGSAAAACTECVGGGNFYQPSSGTCGMAPGMTKSKPAAKVKPPPRPKAMPKTGKEYVTIEPGTYEIGARDIDTDKRDDKEVFDATVTITRPFMMKTTEVTEAEWYFITGEVSPSYDKTCGLDCPVGHITWRRALDYLNLLSKKEGLEPCYDLKKPMAKWSKGLDCTGYRLPTEAEWEYAARAGNEEPRYGELDDIAWYADNSGGVPHPVGKKQKNAYGLYDMLGSHWEWTWDLEDVNTKFTGEMSDPVLGGMEQQSEGESRIVRGGNYKAYASDVRATHRYQYPASGGDTSYGFRPVRTVKPKK